LVTSTNSNYLELSVGNTTTVYMGYLSFYIRKGNVVTVNKIL